MFKMNNGQIIATLVVTMMQVLCCIEGIHTYNRDIMNG